MSDLDKAIELDLAYEAVEQGERELTACEAKVEKLSDHLKGAGDAVVQARADLAARRERLAELTGD